jgi:3-keto-5-aminohexanoate cleavage enzyme
MIIQFSTGGRRRDAAARGSALYLKPDMASLSTGSVNFPTNVHENCAAGRRLGDTNAETQRASRDRNLRSDIHGARRLVDSWLINERLHVQFVMGVKNGLPAQEHLLVIPLVELKNAYFQKRPGPLWGSDVINPRSWTGCWHVVGMEFGPGLKLNVRITNRPASNNAELVKVAADMCAKHNARPASPAEARLLLGMTV